MLFCLFAGGGLLIFAAIFNGALYYSLAHLCLLWARDGTWRWLLLFPSSYIMIRLGYWLGGREWPGAKGAMKELTDDYL